MFVLGRQEAGGMRDIFLVAVAGGCWGQIRRQNRIRFLGGCNHMKARYQQNIAETQNVVEVSAKICRDPTCTFSKRCRDER